MEVSQFNFSVSADHTEIIIESLLKEKTISKSDFEKLVSDCDEGQIESVILAVKGKLDVKTVCDFGVALCTYENEESGVVFRYFYEHILFPLVGTFGLIICDRSFLFFFFKLSVEQSTAFQEMFCGVYKKFYRLIKIEDVVKRLFCCGVFLQNISKLDAEFKNEILRWVCLLFGFCGSEINACFVFSNVVLNCRQLDENYVKVLECLLDKNTHHSVIKMIVVFLASQGETKDKALGKLLVSLIQILGRNIHQFEQPLRQIIAHHKSVWRTKIQKTFNEHYECSQSSQSLIKTNV